MNCILSETDEKKESRDGKKEKKKYKDSESALCHM